MKKVIFTMIVIIMMVSICVSACAEIQFRGIDWYSKFSVVDQILTEESGYMSIRFGEYTCALPDIRFMESMICDNAVAGEYKLYYNIPIAGYTSTVQAYFMYPICDGKIVRSQADSEFYFGMYQIDDVVDEKFVYDDFVAKLTTLYGEGTDRVGNEYEGMYWEDEEGNSIFICRYPKYPDLKMVLIGYFAAGSDERIQELNALAESEAYENEINSALENSNNTSGL